MGNYISRIFADSPVNAIQEHCDRCYKATRELVELFNQLFAGNWDAVDASRAVSYTHLTLPTIYSV